jgi:tetratricopeptide (TPR) repeat protein
MTQTRKQKNELSYHEIAHIYYVAGKVYLEQEKYTEAIRKFKRAIKQLEKNNVNHNNITSYQFISNAKGRQIAIASNSAIGINENEDEDRRLLAYCLGNLGNAYYEQKKYSAAIKVYQLAIIQLENLDMRNNDDDRYLAACHSNAAVMFSKKKDYSSAIKEHEFAIAKLESIHDKSADDRRHSANYRNSIGTDYYYQKKYNIAIKEIELAINELNNIPKIEVEDKRNLAVYDSNIRKAYSDQTNENQTIEMKQEKSVLLANSLLKKQNTNSSAVSVKNQEANNLTFSCKKKS